VRGVHVEPRREGRDATQERAILVGEQAVAPGDGRAQRRVPVVAPAAGGEHPQAVVQGRLQAVEAQHREPGRREFDRQGHAVERPAQRGHPGGVG
jgi:hypothetical protein